MNAKMSEVTLYRKSASTSLNTVYPFITTPTTENEFNIKSCFLELVLDLAENLSAYSSYAMYL